MRSNGPQMVRKLPWEREEEEWREEEGGEEYDHAESSSFATISDMEECSHTVLCLQYMNQSSGWCTSSRRGRSVVERITAAN